MDADLLKDIVERHVPSLVLYARQLCATPNDVVQEALVRLVQQREPPDPLLPWLYRVVRNQAIDAARKKRRRLHHERLAAEQAQSWFLPAGGEQLDAQTAAEALAAIPLDQREVLVAHIWSGLTFREIGQVMGISDSTAHRRYEAGLKALRERLAVPCNHHN
jgi:RNA polymerase sigma factor (sigma-70 family)